MPKKYFLFSDELKNKSREYFLLFGELDHFLKKKLCLMHSPRKSEAGRSPSTAKEATTTKASPINAGG